MFPRSAPHSWGARRIMPMPCGSQPWHLSPAIAGQRAGPFSLSFQAAACRPKDSGKQTDDIAAFTDKAACDPRLVAYHQRVRVKAVYDLDQDAGPRLGGWCRIFPRSGYAIARNGARIGPAQRYLRLSALRQIGCGRLLWRMICPDFLLCQARTLLGRHGVKQQVQRMVTGRRPHRPASKRTKVDGFGVHAALRCKAKADPSLGLEF